tara:strand:+ start:164 stop:1252 length:1089 start_codon:yes stop_codon:yes gene_type:complete
MFKNLLLSFISLLLFSVIFFSGLNFLLGGVPLFGMFKIDIEEMVYVLKNDDKEKYKNIVETKNFHYRLSRCGKRENGFVNLLYKEDRFGFRNDNEDLYFNTDFVILGDSFGIGSCVNYPYDLTSQLKKEFNNNKFLNLSVAGTGPFYQKELFETLMSKTNTKYKTLIWFFYEGNDHEDININFNKELNFALERPIKRSWETFRSDKEDFFVNYFPLKNIHIIKLKIYLANYFRGFGTLAKYLKNFPPLINSEKNYESLIENFNEYLINNKIENKIIYYIPKYTRLTYKNINHPQLNQLDSLKNFIKKTAIKNNFDFIDGSTFFHNRIEPLDVFYYDLPTHFNEKGYNLLAEHLKIEYDKLKK